MNFEVSVCEQHTHKTITETHTSKDYTSHFGSTAFVINHRNDGLIRLGFDATGFMCGYLRAEALMSVLEAEKVVEALQIEIEKVKSRGAE